MPLPESRVWDLSLVFSLLVIAEKVSQVCDSTVGTLGTMHCDKYAYK